MKQSPIKIVFTDLDGTLLNTARSISARNLACLRRLGENGVVRVIATGRSPYSFGRVMYRPFPADYLIFSSGAGILDLATGRLLHASNLTKEDVTVITGQLLAQQADFMVHQPVPENHRFVYSGSRAANVDFNRRILLYDDFAAEHTDSLDFPAPAAQVIAVLPAAPARFAHLKSCLAGYQVTRTTSPLDHRSIWMEIQPPAVHKGSAAAWLCSHLGLTSAESLSIGNDYNDLDLLDFSPRSYLLVNAPPELHQHYRLCPTNDEDGFSHAVEDGFAAS